MAKLYFITLFTLAYLPSTVFCETRSLVIETNYLPMPDTQTVHYDPKITTNQALFIQISDATGIPPQEMQVDLGAGFYLPKNNELVGKTQFFMVNKNGKTKVVASVKF